MKIRVAGEEDLGEIMRVINTGKEYLRKNGCPQWQNGYPNEDYIIKDIRSGHSYVGELDGKIVGTFAIEFGHDPMYDTLTEGQWINPGLNYLSVVRLVIDTSLQGRGIGMMLLREAEKIYFGLNVDSYRATTYPQNKAVLKILMSNGYYYCGKVQAWGRQVAALEKLAKKPHL